MVAGCVRKLSFTFVPPFETGNNDRSFDLFLSPHLLFLSTPLPSRPPPPPPPPLHHSTVPVRVVGDDDATKLTAENVRVLLVTSRSGAGLVFPKGGWETDESCEAAAARETVEEAGVRGDLEPEPLGTFRFASSKNNENVVNGSGEGNGAGGAGGGGGGERQQSKKSSAATMFALRVREELEEWPESGQRCRVWLSPGDALAACKHAWMREALGVWAARHGIGGGASGGSGGGSEGETRNGRGDGDNAAAVAGPSSASRLPLQPSPGGRERAAAAAIKAAKAAGLGVVPWIKLAVEEEEDKGGAGAKAAKTAAAAAAATK